MLYKQKRNIDFREYCFRAWGYNFISNSSKINRGIFIVGGSFGEFGSIYESILLKDCDPMNENKVSLGDLIPTSLSKCGAVAGCIDSNSNILLIGGWMNESETPLMETILSINPTDWKTKKINSFIPICYASSCSDIDGNIFLTGGGNSPYRDADVYSNVYMLRHNDLSNLMLLSNNNEGDSFSGNINLVPQAQDYWNRNLPNMLSRRCGHSSVTLFNNNIVGTM
jgi:hypothetical protein